MMRGAPSFRAPALALALLGSLWLIARTLPTPWIDRVWIGLWTPTALALRSALADSSPLPLTLYLALAVGTGALLLATTMGRGWRRRLLWAAVPLLALGPLFEFSFGLGYRRSTLAEQLELPSEAATAAMLLDLGGRLKALIWTLDPGDPSPFALDAPWPLEAIADGGRCVALSEQRIAGRAAPLATTTVVRRLPAGTLLRSGFVGITDPWTLEVFVDAGLAPLSALQTALHEWGHALRYAREADTEALALLAGLACENELVRFASALSALVQVQREGLRRFSSDVALRQEFLALAAELPLSAQVAFAAAQEATDRYRSAVAEGVTRASYDLYLRVQGSEAGLADYGRAAAILMAADARCSSAVAPPSWCPTWP